MPAELLSFHVTDAYRDRVQQLHLTFGTLLRLRWSQITTDLDETYEAWLTAAAPAITLAQRQAVEASGAYLTAFLTSEFGSPTEASPIETAPYAGWSRDGRPLREALASPLIAVKSSLARGADLPRALRDGQVRMERMVGLEIDHAALDSLLHGIDADDQFDGWERAVRGTCGACLAAATGPTDGLLFPRHPHCKCVAEPRVRGVPIRFPRPTGAALFAAMTPAQQDEAVGPAVAESIREGEIALADLLGVSAQATTEDFLTQASVASSRGVNGDESTRRH